MDAWGGFALHLLKSSKKNIASGHQRGLMKCGGRGNQQLATWHRILSSEIAQHPISKAKNILNTLKCIRGCSGGREEGVNTSKNCSQHGAMKPIQLKCINLPIRLESRALTHEIQSAVQTVAQKGSGPLRGVMWQVHLRYDRGFMICTGMRNSCWEGVWIRGPGEFVTLKTAGGDIPARVAGVDIQHMSLTSDCILRYNNRDTNVRERHPG